MSEPTESDGSMNREELLAFIQWIDWFGGEIYLVFDDRAHVPRQITPQDAEVLIDAYLRRNGTVTNEPVITVYGKPDCQQCSATTRALHALRAKHPEVAMLAYRHVNVVDNDDALLHVMSLGYTSVPVVELPDGQHWNGFRPDRIAKLVQG